MEQQQLFRVREKRNKGWFWIDNDYFNGYVKVFGLIALSVYLELCRYVDRNQKCFPSEKTIGENIGVSDRTIRKYIKLFEKYHFIEITKERASNGKWLNNTYWLLDKSEWEKPENIHFKYPSNRATRGGIRTSGKPVPTALEQQNQRKASAETSGKPVPLKEDSLEGRPIKKNIPKGIEKTLFSYGNENINTIYGFLKEKLGGSPDGSQKENRRFAKLLLDRFKKDYPDKDPIDLVEFLIEAGLQDSFHSKNATNFRYLYYNAQKIIASVRQKSNKIAIIKTK